MWLTENNHNLCCPQCDRQVMSLHSSNWTSLSITQSLNATRANKNPIPTKHLRTHSLCYRHETLLAFLFECVWWLISCPRLPSLSSAPPFRPSGSLFRVPHVQLEIKPWHCVGESATAPIDAHQREYLYCAEASSFIATQQESVWGTLALDFPLCWVYTTVSLYCP